MSHWNYRVVRSDGHYAVHEVFYRDDGSVEAWTEVPVALSAETLDDLRAELQSYAAALDRPPIEAETNLEPS